MARLLILGLTFLTLTANARDLNKEYEKAKFRIGKKEFEAYIADNDDRRSQGLMFIKKLPTDTGMLFVFEQEQALGFWMKNTLIPLSIGFFDAKGKLVDVQEMKVAASLLSVEVPSYQSRRPALFALEMMSGWFEKHKIKNGSRLELLSKPASKLLTEKLNNRP